MKTEYLFITEMPLTENGGDSVTKAEVWAKCRLVKRKTELVGAFYEIPTSISGWIHTGALSLTSKYSICSRILAHHLIPICYKEIG